MAGHMSANFFARAANTTSSGSGSGSRRSSKHQSVDSPPPTLPLAILNSSPETSNVDGDEAYEYERPQHPVPLHELKGRCWSTFFTAPSSNQLLSGEKAIVGVFSKFVLIRFPIPPLQPPLNLAASLPATAAM